MSDWKPIKTAPKTEQSIQKQVTEICETWVADGRGNECFWEGWPEQPDCQNLTPNMVLAALKSETLPDLVEAGKVLELLSLVDNDGHTRFQGKTTSERAADTIRALIALATALEAAPHVNETPKTEHDGADVLSATPPDLVEALRKLHHAVCGETGFAACVRMDSGKEYPWPALDEADAAARAILAALEGKV